MHHFFLILTFLPNILANFKSSSLIVLKSQNFLPQQKRNIPCGKACDSNPIFTRKAFEINRGGACDDSHPILFAKVGVAAIVETAGLLGILAGSQKLSSEFSLFEIYDVNVLVWISLFIVIFASSFVSTIVDGGLSVATNQVLNPNVIPGDPSWYDNLVKPVWNPPAVVFPIMWLIVSKPTQLAALVTLFKTNKAPWSVIALYCAHLSFGNAWNKVFFGYQCIGRGAAVITVFFGLLLASAYQFYLVDMEAGKLMVPTCLWVFVATALNWSIYLKN